MISLLLLITAMPHVTVETVPYSVVNGDALQMDVYTTVHEDPVSVVIVIHGGAWVSGQRSDMAELCFAIARSGMVAMTIDYRLAPQSKWPAMLEDAQAALRFAKAEARRFGGDPERIAVTGASAGGHLALLLGTMDETAGEVDAVLNLFGPTDLTKDFAPILMAVMAEQLLGKDLVDAMTDLKAMSPVSHASPGDPPIFTVHGKDDPLVPHMQAERLEEAHPDHSLLSVEGMAHGIDVGRREQTSAIVAGIEFLIEKLGA